MTSAKKALVVLIVATLGIWGCAQGQSSNAVSQADRIKVLEAKNAKLEEDFRAAAAVRDQCRKKLATADEQQQQLRQDLDQQLQAVVRERDELRQQVTTRTNERDAMVTQYENFRKSIRELLGQADTALNHSAEHPVTSAADIVPPGKS
jgi:DNA anti-recombination protein RmuC